MVYKHAISTVMPGQPIQLFETGDERYAWLNNIQAVGIGGLDGTDVVYDIYELL